MADTTDTPTFDELPSGSVWIASREVSGALDAWHEHLYAAPRDGGVWLGVWAHQALGEVPGSWYDEDGELLPMHQTADGDLRLPEVFGGQQVVDFLDGMFVGALQPTGDAVLVVDAEDDTVRMALGALEWPLGAAEEVKAAVHLLQGAPGTSRACAPLDKR